MYTSAKLIINKFEALLFPVKFVYNYRTTVGCTETDMEHFGPNDLFVHLLELF